MAQLTLDKVTKVYQNGFEVLTVGGSVRLHLDTTRVHLFDPVTKQAISVC
jgi:hypothetical protein